MLYLQYGIVQVLATQQVCQIFITYFTNIFKSTNYPKKGYRGFLLLLLILASFVAITELSAKFHHLFMASSGSYSEIKCFKYIFICFEKIKKIVSYDTIPLKGGKNFASAFH